MEQKIHFLLDILKRYDHYIGTTNFKVGLMMSFLGAIVLSVSIRIMMLEGADENVIIVWAAILTIAVSLVTIFKLLGVVFPNTRSPANFNSLMFFGDVANYKDGSFGYFKAIKIASEEDILKDIAMQTHSVAVITSNKFERLQSSVNFIKFGVLPILFITLLAMLTS